MADETSSAGPLAPAAPAAPPSVTITTTTDGTSSAIPPIAAPAPAPTNDRGEEIRLSSRELQKRLDETRESARARFVKDLGFEKPEDLKAVLKAAKDAEDAKLSEIERLRKQADEYKPRAERAAELEARLTALVDDQFKDLPEAVRTAIDEVAGGKAEDRLRMMDVFRKSGLLRAQTPATGAAPTVGAAPHAPTLQQAPVAPMAPANTGGAPPPRPVATRTKFEEYVDLEKTNPVAASIFFLANRREIEKTRPAAS